MQRKLSLTRPDTLVASSAKVLTSWSLHAVAINASFSFSAGESSTTGVTRRGGTLPELTEREREREGVLEAIAVPASRVQQSVPRCTVEEE